MKLQAAVIFTFLHNAKLYIHRWIYVMWTYVYRDFYDHIWAVYQCVELQNPLAGAPNDKCLGKRFA